MLGQTKEMASQQSREFLYHFSRIRLISLQFAGCCIFPLDRKTSSQGWLLLQLPLPALQHQTSLALVTRHLDLVPCSAVPLQGHLQEEKEEGLNMSRQQ